MQNRQPMSLVHVYERTVGWLRSPFRRSAAAAARPAPSRSRVPQPAQPPVVPVRVNLVGDLPRTGREPAPAPASPQAHPFLATTAGKTVVASSRATPHASGSLEPVPEWQFNQPVLLRRSRRASSVVAWTVVGGLGVAAVWAMVAPLGETVAVQGKLEPGSSVRQVQAPVPGVIEEVLVQEGELVRRGDVLVRFDLSDARSRLTTAETIRERLINENQILSASLGDRPASGLTANQRLQLGSQAEDLRSRRAMADEQLRASEARIAGLRQSLSTAANIAERYERLAAEGAVSEVQALDTRNKANEIATSLAAEERTADSLRASRVNVEAGPSAELRGRIEANLRQISDLDNQISQARLQLQYGVLIAPTDGSVFDIDVSKGSVVETSRTVLRVVPNDDLIARVYIPNDAIGHIAPGQRAEVSLATFPSSDYGPIPARIERIATDALTTEEMAENLRTDAQGLFFPATLQLDSQRPPKLSAAVALKPGMALTADIHLRERTVMALFTSFFNNRQQELRRVR
jgi:hemolysin D